MTDVRITKRVFDGLEPKAGEFTFWDGDIPGFGVRVRPSGAKSFVVMYRVGGRNSPLRKVTLGSGSKLTVEEARTEARKVLAKAELGEDTAEKLAKGREAKTMAEFCDLYLADAERGNIIGKRGAVKKASTLATDKGRIARHIKPLLGKKLVRDVKRSDIERFLRDVANGKTATDQKTKKHGRAIVTGGKGTATRTVRLLGGIFSYAVQLGIRPDNPTHGVAKYADKQGERFLNTEELERLGIALREAETVGILWNTDPDKAGAKHLPKNAEDRRSIIGPHAAAAIRLLILTGCRLREILGLKWQYVDLERGFFRLPDSKTGAKVFMLAAPALAVLDSLPRIAGCDFVIAGQKLDKPRSDMKRPWALVMRAALLKDIRIHDLRHTYASHGAAAGMGLTIVGRLLGHADVKTTNRYSHFDADPLRRAANTVASSLTAAMKEAPAADESNVVPLRKVHSEG